MFQRHSSRQPAAVIQPLEPRRLLSFTPVGGERVVDAASPLAVSAPYDAFDVAVAGDGSYWVTSFVAEPSLAKRSKMRRTSAASASLTTSLRSTTS